MLNQTQRIIQIISLISLPLLIITTLIVEEIYPLNTTKAIEQEQLETTNSSILETKETTVSAILPIEETTPEAQEKETTVSATPNEIIGTTIHIDAGHANIGRLFNLWQVKESLQGKEILYGETFSFNRDIELTQAGLKYMYGYTVNSVFPAGGVCGASSALAGEVDRIGKDLVRSDDGGRHPTSYHTSGGLYWNLPNVAVFFDGYKHTDLRVTNTNPNIKYQIIITTNYDDLWTKIGIDLVNWQASGSRWEEYLDPHVYTSTNEFQFTISLQEMGI